MAARGARARIEPGRNRLGCKRGNEPAAAVRLAPMNIGPKRLHRILWVFSLQVLLLYSGSAAFSPETKDSTSTKKKFQDIQVGPFRLDLGANIHPVQV